MLMTLAGWLVLIAWIGLISILDYYLRLSDADILTGGLSSVAYWLVSLPLLLGIAILWWTGSKNLDPYTRIVSLLGQGILGLATWFVLSLFYICSAGIDCT